MLLRKLAFVALASCASAQQLSDVLAAQPSLSNLTSMLALFPNLVGELASASQITLLAPNNDAFAGDPTATAAIAKNDTSFASTLISYHILDGSHSNFTSKPEFLPSLLQSTMYTNVTGGQVVEAFNKTFTSGLLQNTNATAGPITFSGGVIYIIDSLLTFPQNISSTILDLNLTAAVGALNKTGMTQAVDDLTDVTVFIPSNQGFQAVDAALANVSMAELEVILQYHVVKGTVGYSSILGNMSLPTLQGGNVSITVEENGDVFVNSAMVIISDILVANGVVHIIDNVLNPANPTAKPNPTASTQSLVFPVPSSSSSASSAASGTNVPFTSGVPKGSTTVPTSGSGHTSTAAAAAPMKTGAMAAAALFGGAAVMMNI